MNKNPLKHDILSEKIWQVRQIERDAEMQLKNNDKIKNVRGS